jgi:hypothetical protein
MSEQEILRQLEVMGQKIDPIASLLESIRADRESRIKPRTPRVKAAALTQEETEQHQTRFRQLYEQWLSGDELGVQGQLDKLDVEELRRFGDSNNLNVTSKMSKDRVLQLIGARFRERKQLHHVRPSPTNAG